MLRKFIVFGSAAGALLLSAFNTAKEKFAPADLYVAGASSACQVVNTGTFSSYFTIAPPVGSQQARITSITGAPHLMWQTSACSGAGNEVFFDDPNQ